uniref:Uncharacterized protein n=1 Tax=Palpitomonas bilix TaxID=652834 RepID=A0A7S3LWF0_9EUKA|mmetsp:Transcript_6519/g.16171  ORF Transcript_6519/g.16171 Transcript_6519/m.16171 type:complete len:174 (+) Transcript_6519:76-597(+)
MSAEIKSDSIYKAEPFYYRVIDSLIQTLGDNVVLEQSVLYKLKNAWVQRLKEELAPDEEGEGEGSNGEGAAQQAGISDYKVKPDPHTEYVQGSRLQTDGANDDESEKKRKHEAEGDDVDVDDDDDEETQDLILAQYEKVSKARGKWKIALKDGVAKLGDEEYVFKTAQGEFEW